MADGVQKYFLDAFAVSGDKASVPNVAPVDGSVSYDVGFGPKYQQDPATTGLNIPRDQFNQLMYDLTQAIKVLQEQGFPSWISDAGSGTPFSYSVNDTCRHNAVNYYSLVDSNTDEPPSAKWGVVTYAAQAASTLFPGDIVDTLNTVLPAGWLWVDNKTIGNASSGGTARANADTYDLFEVLWTGCSNAVAPIQTSSGTPSTRGISAAADFAANKRMPLIDFRGKAKFTADNLGGTAASILTASTTQGLNGAVLGATGGEQAHTSVITEMVGHAHSGSGLSAASGGAHAHTISSWPIGTDSGAFNYGGPKQNVNNVSVTTDSGGTHTHSISGTTGSAGSGQAFNEIPPGVVVYTRIKL